MKAEIMTTILTLTPLSEDLRELDIELQQWIRNNNIMQELWEKQLISKQEGVYRLKGKPINLDKKWDLIKARLKQDFSFAEINRQCNNRFSPNGTTESLINRLLSVYSFDEIVNGLYNQLQVMQGNYKFLPGLNVCLNLDRFPSLLELEVEDNFTKTL